jgi:hypothetical protein
VTAPGVGSGGERVFIRLGPPPEEPNQFGSALNQAGGRLSYSSEVRARLEVDAKEIIGRYPCKVFICPRAAPTSAQRCCRCCTWCNPRTPT